MLVNKRFWAKYIVYVGVAVLLLPYKTIYSQWSGINNPDSTGCLVCTPKYARSMFGKPSGIQKGMAIFEYGGAIVVLGGLSSFWYSGNDSKFNGFKFFNDWNEWNQMDKVGHLVTSYHFIRTNNELVSLFGIPKCKANFQSLVVGASFMTAIEILDGFSPNYGFSVGDLATNFGGIGLALIQQKWNLQQAFNLKFTYGKTQFAQLRPELLGSTGWERWLKDYNGQTYWLSFNIHHLLNKPKIPAWLGIAFGYGANGMTGGSNNVSADKEGNFIPEFTRERQYYLSLDIHPEHFFKPNTRAHKILAAFSFLKIPLPGISITNGKLNGGWLMQN